MLLGFLLFLFVFEGKKKMNMFILLHVLFGHHQPHL